MGEFTAWGRKNRVVSSFTHLAVDTGDQWGPQRGPLARTPRHSFSPWPEFLKTWQPRVYRAPQVNVLRETVEVAPSFITEAWKSPNVTSPGVTSLPRVRRRAESPRILMQDVTLRGGRYCGRPFFFTTYLEADPTGKRQAEHSGSPWMCRHETTQMHGYCLGARSLKQGSSSFWSLQGPICVLASLSSASRGGLLSLAPVPLLTSPASSLIVSPTSCSPSRLLIRLLTFQG